MTTDLKQITWNVGRVFPKKTLFKTKGETRSALVLWVCLCVCVASGEKENVLPKPVYVSGPKELQEQ
jgi:hypothetical protein